VHEASLAATAHMRRAHAACRWDPIKTAKTSFLGTLNMLGLAKRCRARLLITSTSEVYGDPLQHPQTEEYWGNVNCIGERSCYDEGEQLQQQ
jgi:UDP-glucuronate decarboxylase